MHVKKLTSLPSLSNSGSSEPSQSSSPLFTINSGISSPFAQVNIWPSSESEFMKAINSSASKYPSSSMSEALNASYVFVLSGSSPHPPSSLMMKSSNSVQVIKLSPSSSMVIIISSIDISPSSP